MHRIKTILLSVIASTICLLPFPSLTHAQENFSTEYNVTYTIQGDGKTTTKIDVILTNKTSQFIASSYSLQVGFDEITQVQASDQGGALIPKVTKNEGGHAIALTFNNKVVGINNKKQFSVIFETPGVAKKQGKIWEINIPGIADPDEFSDFTVTVVPPPELVNPIYTKPGTTDGSLTFTKDQLGKSGISIAFGQDQIYTFALTYHLKNTNVFPIQTEIALPPNTNYQEILIDSIEPAPSDVIIDRDGNWLAQYTIAPTDKQDIVVRGKARLSLIPKKVPLSDDQRREYLKPQEYWEVNDRQIKDLANRLKTPENIYKYVVETLNYDFSRVTNQQERFGAVKALDNKNAAVCREFTDLFITLARAAGIPARELNGYAHTENVKQRPLSLVSDVLHAWPEYYDDKKQAWIMVDPTWGNTTGGIDYFNVFDFDHFVFVRKGEDSNYPIAAGGYKSEEDREKKDVTIGFSFDFEKKEDLVLTPEYASVYASGFPIRGSVNVTNTGNALFEKDILFFASQNLTPESPSATIGNIPPYGQRIVPFGFQSTPLLTNGKFDFTIARNGKTTYHEVIVSPFMITKLRLLGGVTIGISIFILFIIAYTTRRVLILRRRK